MVSKIFIALVLFVSFLSADMFERGGKSFGASLGAGSSFGQTYTVLGVNANYFLVDNLSVGVGYRGWFGASPEQHEATLESNYYVPLSTKFYPYLGAFVRETFVNSNYIDDYETYGAKAGVAMILAKNTFLSFGYVVEYFSDCQVGECSSSYPELVFGLAF